MSWAEACQAMLEGNGVQRTWQLAGITLTTKLHLCYNVLCRYGTRSDHSVSSHDMEATDWELVQ